MSVTNTYEQETSTDKPEDETELSVRRRFGHVAVADSFNFFKARWRKIVIVGLGAVLSVKGVIKLSDYIADREVKREAAPSGVRFGHSASKTFVGDLNKPNYSKEFWNLFRQEFPDEIRIIQQQAAATQQYKDEEKAHMDLDGDGYIGPPVFK